MLKPTGEFLLLCPQALPTHFAPGGSCQGRPSFPTRQGQVGIPTKILTD